MALWACPRITCSDLDLISNHEEHEDTKITKKSLRVLRGERKSSIFGHILTRQLLSQIQVAILILTYDALAWLRMSRRS